MKNYVKLILRTWIFILELVFIFDTEFWKNSTLAVLNAYNHSAYHMLHMLSSFEPIFWYSTLYKVLIFYLFFLISQLREIIVVHWHCFLIGWSFCRYGWDPSFCSNCECISAFIWRYWVLFLHYFLLFDFLLTHLF